jgi:S1-C subfamily serine protease
MTDLPRVVAESDVGSVAIVEVWRKNKKVIIEVELGELPEQTYVKTKSPKKES